jgi:drug/metabolite transporter, DME family
VGRRPGSQVIGPVTGDFTWLPIVLALGSACMFGMSAVTSRRGTMHIPPQAGVIISLGASSCTFLALSPLWFRAEDWSSVGVWVFVINGCFHPLLSMYFWLEAIQRAGATVASTFTATAPLFATATAIVFLDESITSLILVGTLGTIAGVITLSWGPIGFTRALKVALIFATAAAMVRGLNHTVGRFGLGIMPNPLMAGFLSSTVAFLGSLVLYRVRNRRFPERPSRAGVPYMILTGMMACGGMAFLYSALQVGTVVVVSPLIATYPVFTLIIAVAIGMEQFNRRILAGVALVVAGVIVISLARNL